MPFGRIGELTSTIRVPPEHYSRLSSDRIRYVQPRSASLSNVRVDVYAELCRLHSSHHPVAPWCARFFAAKTLAGLSNLLVAPSVPNVGPARPPSPLGELLIEQSESLARNNETAAVESARVPARLASKPQGSSRMRCRSFTIGVLTALTMSLLLPVSAKAASCPHQVSPALATADSTPYKVPDEYPAGVLGPNTLPSGPVSKLLVAYNRLGNPATDDKAFLNQFYRLNPDGSGGWIYPTNWGFDGQEKPWT